MRMTSWLAALRAIAVTAGFTLACTVAVAAGGRYILISHAPDSDRWWDTVRNAAQHAASDFQVQVDYRNPAQGDLGEMAQLIEQAADQGYDGIVTTLADFVVLRPALAKVVAKGVPLVTINSGTVAQSEKIGALMHVGQPEYEAGHAAGQRARTAGISRFVCINHFASSPAAGERCRGFADAIGADVGSSMLDVGDDPSTIEPQVVAYLRQHPQVQGVLALGPTSAHPALRALAAAGPRGKLWFATFDLSDEIGQAIADGRCQFAVDQQPYLQGYIPVAVLATMKALKLSELATVATTVRANPKVRKRLAEYSLAPDFGPRHIGSGPGFVTRENLETVRQYAGQYR
jgi:simple sugar transport system substrate-binding protein